MSAGVRVAPVQVSVPWSNWPGSVPASAAVVTFRSAVPVLVTVKVWYGELVPVWWLP